MQSIINLVLGIVSVAMIKFTNEELLIIRSALLNFKKAPFVSDGEREVIGNIIKKLYDNLFDK